jgi:hypothetical protein
MDDLCVICPGSHWKAVIEGLLERTRHLGIREITYEVISVPLGRSKVLAQSGSEIAALNRQRFNHCLVILDADRCADERDPQDIEHGLNESLNEAWDGDARALVVDPSLEGWLLEAHRVFSRVPGLRGHDLRRWLADAGYWPVDGEQPDQPRDAMEALFAAFGARTSAANYRIIADNYPIRMDRIETPSFRQFILTLRDWFLP